MPPCWPARASSSKPRRAAAPRTRCCRYAQWPRAVHDCRGERTLRRIDVRSRCSHELERDGAARPRRAAAGRDRARMVRRRTFCGGCAAPRLAALRQEVEPAGAGGARTLPAELARGRSARFAARSASAAAGLVASSVALGDRMSSLRRVPGYQPERARPALRLRRGRLGRRRARPGCRLLPGGRACTRSPADGRPSGGGGSTIGCAPRSRAARFSGSTCCAETGLEAEHALLPALWELVWAGEVTNDAWQPLACRSPLPGVPQASASATSLLASPMRPRSPRRRAAGR